MIEEKLRKNIYMYMEYISRYKLTIELFIALNNNNGICRANKFDSTFQCPLTSSHFSDLNRKSTLGRPLYRLRAQNL